MAGIYIHIPFCKQKCHYCNFYSIVSLKHIKGFLTALLKEIYLQKDYLQNEIVKSIYFGGGTPSILRTSEIASILNEIFKIYNIDTNAEITLEANPDDISLSKLNDLKKTSINRLSIGIQSFNDKDLKYLKRIHNSEQAINSIKLARDAGFTNLSIDLIYGIPTLTKESWLKNLEYFFNSDIPHLSAYSLTIEQKTVLNKLILQKKAQPPDENQSIEHFRILQELIKQKRFIHYEISNFCKEGFYSKHNSIYWLGGNYLGLGPSAHSYNGYSRQWNVSNVSQYINPENYRNIVLEKEILTKEQKYNEYVMTSLRTIWGCDLGYIQKTFGENFHKFILKESLKFIEQELLVFEQNKLFLTDKGKLFADGIASGLFRDNINLYTNAE